MQRIIPLAPSVIAKIAAGEVIERPVFVVKELVENALDAGATEIVIDIEKSGAQKMSVTDNGEGMDKENLHESFKSHTTSKIMTEDDLYHVRSLGFRGEALASIAAVSRLRIQSRARGAPGGNYVELHNGDLYSTGAIGMPEGTTVIVEQLFENVPARKKFLKSNKTEFSHIMELVTEYALHSPHIHFRLVHNKKIIVDLPITSAFDRTQAIIGKTIFEQLMPISFEDTGITVHGFIARPQVHSYSKKKQFVVINNRTVIDKVVGQAVRDVYGSLLPQSAYPIFILSLKIPHDMIDVNVHPRKEYVQFVNAKMVYDAVTTASAAVLLHENITFTQSLNKSIYEKNKTKEKIKEEVLPWSPKNIAEILYGNEPVLLHATYILWQTKQGILLVDFHAAHERILFEQYQQAFLAEKEKAEIAAIEEKIILNLSLTDYELCKDNMDIFTKLGFTITFSKGKVEIHTVPTLLQGVDSETLFREILEKCGDNYGENTIDKKSKQIITYLACRNAIKAGDMLTKDECTNLIKKLKEMKMPFTCPHGRPTQIEVSLEELHKMFKRI